MQQLQFKKLAPQGTIPTKAHDTDAGFDLYSDGNVEVVWTKEMTDSSVAIRARYKYPTSIAVNIPPGYVGLVWPRSGLTIKTGYQTLAGVIDAGYHGDVTVITDIKIAGVKGDRIAQLVVVPIGDFVAQEVDEFTDHTARGTKGWGSSGV